MSDEMIPMKPLVQQGEFHIGSDAAKRWAELEEKASHAEYMSHKLDRELDFWQELAKLRRGQADSARLEAVSLTDPVEKYIANKK